MPAASAWMVRFSFIYLAGGFVTGALMLTDVLPRGIWMTLHADWLLAGFMIQLAFGVASWILPKTPKRPSHTPVRVVGWLLNGGILLATTGVVLRAGTAVGVGRLLVLVSAVAFGVYIWPRVRSFREKLVN